MTPTDLFQSALSVVVLTCNRVRELDRTLRALQRLPTRPRRIVVDNASTDGTAAHGAARFPDVLLVRSSRNLGAAGRNVGIFMPETLPASAFLRQEGGCRASSAG